MATKNKTLSLFGAEGSETIENFAARCIKHAKETEEKIEIVFNDDFRMLVAPETKFDEIISAFHEHRRPVATSAALESMGQILLEISSLDAIKAYELALKLIDLKTEFCSRK